MCPAHCRSARPAGRRARWRAKPGVASERHQDCNAFTSSQLGMERLPSRLGHPTVKEVQQIGDQGTQKRAWRVLYGAVPRMFLGAGAGLQMFRRSVIEELWQDVEFGAASMDLLV